MSRRPLALLAALMGLVLPGSAHALVHGDYLITDTEGGSGGKLFVFQKGPGTVAEVPTNGLLGEPIAVTAGPGGIIYIADQSIPGFGPGVQKLVPGSPPTPLSFGGDFGAPADIAFDRLTGQLVVADAGVASGSGALLQVDPVSGAETAIAFGSQTVDPSGVAIAADGTYYVSDTNAFAGAPGGVFSYTPDPAHTESVVSENGAAANFESPSGIAIRADGKLVVGDGQGAAAAKLILVDPAAPDPDDNQEVIDPTSKPPSPSPPGDGSGSPLDEAVGLAMDGPDLLIADPAGPMGCWLGAATCGDGIDRPGVLARLTLTQSLEFIGGGPASTLSPDFTTPVDIAVMTNQPPTAQVTAPKEARVGEQVTVDAGPSTDPDGDGLRYGFDTDGDGVLDIPPGPNTTYTRSYDSPGTKTIGLEVRDGSDGTDKRTVTIEVSAPPEPGPGPGTTPVQPPAGPTGPTGPTTPTNNPPQTTISVPPLTGVDLQDIAAHGLTLTVGCTEACNVNSELLIDLATAKKLHISARRLLRLGSGSAKLGAAGTAKLKVKLTPKVRRKIKLAVRAARAAGRRRIKLVLRTTTRYSSGTRRTSTRRITLRS